MTACLLIAALLLPSAAGQAAPLVQEEPPVRLPYDGVFDLPRLNAGVSSAPVEGASTPLSPEYTTWSKLVFQSARNNHDWEIFGARGDGSNQVNISNNGAPDMHPRLNRGATRVAFSSKRDGNYELYVMNADGSGQTRLTNNSADDVSPAWSPDGSRIAFQSYRDSQPEIYVTNVTGGGLIRLTNHGDYDGQPAWSPDGAKIAFVRRAGGQYGIWVMNADGSSQRQLSGQAYSEGPAWSPDGSQIAYDCDGNGDGWQEIWLMNVDGGNQRQVYAPGDYQTDAWVRSWSPDGRYVAFTRISWTYYQGQWYWTTAYLEAWDSATPWNTIRLSSNGADWNPAWETTDALAPTSSVQALPAQSPAVFTVRWSGADTGGSGLKNYDVQVRDGAGGAWSNWKANTTDTSAIYTGVGGHIYYFRSRARDNAGNVEAWPAGHDAVTAVEAFPPQTAVVALPTFSRNGLLVRWGGNDPGGSGIASYDVQYRQGSSAWTDWRMGVTETSASFTGTSGADYRFRARARDGAQNVEAWPGTADASTTLYTWAIAGQATDNRGAPVAGMGTTTSPAAFHTVPSDSDGAYAAHIATEATSYGAVWSKPGYGALPSTAFSSDPDAVVGVVLPPADNVVQNWGFENGSSSWQFGGSLAATVVQTDKHSGTFAALLGSQARPLQSITNLGEPLVEIWQRPFDVAADSAGNFHSVWVETNQRIMVSRASSAGPWSAPLPLPIAAGVNCWGLDLNADSAGSTYLVLATSAGVYFLHNQSGAGWSTPELIPGTSPSSDAPAVAVSSNGTVKVIVSGPGQLYNDVYFVERRPGVGWTQVRQIAVTYGIDEQFRIALDPSGLAHLLWNGGDESGYADFLYTSEKGDGSWTAPVNLSQYHSHPGDAAMVIDSQGTVHVLWSTDGIYYRMHSAGGPWAQRITLAPADLGGVSLFVDDSDQIHAAWGDIPLSQVRYAKRSNGTWSEPVGVSPATVSPSQSAPKVAVDSQNRVHVLWRQYQNLNDWSIHYSRQDGASGWLPDLVVFENDHDTSRPHLLLAPNGTPTAVWYAHVNGAYRVMAAGPEPVQATAEAIMSQSIQVQSVELAPTLSFLHRFGTEFASDSRLEVAIDDGVAPTVVFTANIGSDTWEHQWVDLTPWAGRSVTLRFKVIEVAGGAHAWAYIDEVTVGSAHPDVWVGQPSRLAAAPDRVFDATLTYGNRGGVTASNSRVTLQLPPDLSFVSADPPPSATSPLRWDVGDLAGQSANEIRVTLRVTASASGGTTLATTASISSDTVELEQANNTAAGAVFVGSLTYLPMIMR